MFVKTSLSKNPKKIVEYEQKHNMVSVGERIRKSCEELGPTFVKLGQILSTRTDIVTENVANQLKKLQDSVTPFSFEQAKKLIEDELDDSIENLFAEFNDVPIASASISQVYRAKLLSGAQVAVKVQRPNIAQSIETDLGILEQLAKIVDRYSKYGKLYDFSGMVKEFRRVMENEIDFTKEGENTDNFRAHLADHPNVRTPKIKWVYTTPKILTMEFVDGIKINDISQLDELGADRTKLAKEFTVSLVHQILIDGFFHADPHPGNVMVVDAKYIEFIDLGMVGTVSNKFRRQLTALLLGVATQNTRKIAQSISEMDVADANVNLRQFERSLDVLLDEYLYVPLSKVNIAKVFTGIFSIAGDYKMKIPREFALVAKALGTAQGIVEELDPSVNILSIAQKTIKGVMLHAITSKEAKNSLQSYVLDSIEVVKDVPSILLNFMKKIQDNDFAIELKIKNLQKLERSAERMFNRISFAVVLLAICIVMAGIIISVGYSMGQSKEMYDLSFFALRAGVFLSGIIVTGIVFSIIRSSIKKN